MSYVFQTFVMNQVVTAAQLNQIELNIRDHQHGVAGVSDGVLAKTASTITVVNTTTETVVYTSSVPAGTLSTFNAIRLTLEGKLLNNTGATRGITWRVKFGGTTIASRADSFTTSADRLAVFLEARISPRAAATGTQIASFLRRLSNPVAMNGTGALSAGDVVAFHDSVAEDSTVAKTLEVTAQFDFANSLLEFVKHYAVLEVLR